MVTPVIRKLCIIYAGLNKYGARARRLRLRSARDRLGWDRRAPAVS
jgi:hypothetical protein